MYFRTISVSDDGTVWIGNPGGLTRYDGQTWHTFNEEDGMVERSIRRVRLSPEGDVWAASSAGFSRYRPDNPSLVASDQNTTPQVLKLSSYPNPFNAESTIEFMLPRHSTVKLAIYTVTGQQVRSLVTDILPAGLHRLVWKGCDDAGRELSSGMYLYRIEIDGFMAAKKMMLFAIG